MEDEQVVSGDESNLAQQQQDIDSVYRGACLARDVLKDFPHIKDEDAPELATIRDLLAQRIMMAVDWLLAPVFPHEDKDAPADREL